MPKMNGFHDGNHWGGLALTLLNVVHVLNVLNVAKDASLARWALFFNVRVFYYLFFFVLVASPSP